jgi:4-amino-4-deoxy-L-arabinose transferase-like glycosyltransferase
MAPMLVLFLLPLAILLVDHQWIFGDPVRDPWIYYGYFRNGPEYLATFKQLYYSSRPSVIFPGYWVHSLLAPIPGNLVLHLGMYWASLFSFYAVARVFFGARAALLSALCLGSNPFFLLAVGQNYVDGFGITYFLLALLGLTVAGRGRFRKISLAFAGACAAAMISANLFYVIFLPFIVVFFLNVDRRERPREILPSAALFSAGGAAAFASFGFLSKAAGGSFLYLLSSSRFVRSFVQQANPFKAPWRQWLPGAVWLSVPVIISIGSLIVLIRSRPREAGGTGRRVRFAQLLFIAFAFLMLGCQLSPYAAVLQYSYYASLLIPLASLAFAGQVAFLLRAAPSPGWLPGLILAAAVLTAGLGLNDPQRLPLSRFPALLALLVGLGAPIALWIGAAGARTAAILLLSVAVSQSVAKQFVPFGRSFEQFHQDRASLFREIDESITAVRQIDRSGNVFFWWDASEDLAQVYDCIAATSLSGKRIVNLGFPDTRGGVMADGGRMTPHMKIVILSREPQFAKAENALSRIGLHGRLLTTKRIAVTNGGFTMMFLELARDPAARRAVGPDSVRPPST